MQTPTKRIEERIEERIIELKGEIWFMETDIFLYKINLPEDRVFTEFTAPHFFQIRRANRELGRLMEQFKDTFGRCLDHNI